MKWTGQYHTVSTENEKGGSAGDFVVYLSVTYFVCKQQHKTSLFQISVHNGT
jgi:uncharacterized protein involved in high-affinity Fe2+ transport